MRSSFFSTGRGLVAIVALAFGIGASIASEAGAVQPSPDADRYEVDRRGEEPPAPARLNAPPAVATLERSAEWKEFAARHSGWTARWDMTSRIPERLQGPPLPIPGFARADTTNAEAAARAFLREELRPWVPVDDLTWVRTSADHAGLWVHFRQAHEGVPVWNSRVSVRLTGGGRVALVANRTYPQMPSAGAFRSAPGAALEAARDALPGSPAPLREPIMTFLPIRRAGHYEQRLAWRYEFRTQDPPGAWTSFVDAADGSLLWRFNAISYAEVHGQVTGIVEPLTPGIDLQEVGLPHLYVTCSLSGADRVTVLTDAEGSYSLTTAAATGRAVEARLVGVYGAVFDSVPGGPIPFVAGSAPDGESAGADLRFDDSDASIEERDAYHSAMVAHAWVKRIEPANTFVDYTMPITVNVNRTCNAFWDGYGVNFFRAGNGCVNTARVADVVYHEYGHGVTDLMYRPFYPSGAMAEGFSDYFAATITGQPLIGIGFHGPGTFLRRIDVDRIYPRDWADEVHLDGLIIASALWDMRQVLGATRADALYHFAKYGHADNFDDYFFDLLLADDDDGDVYNGTPNLDAIAHVFRAHGIGDYGIHVAHVPHPDTEDTTQPLSLTASFLGVYALQPALARVHAAVIRGVDTTRVETTMTPTGNSREYTAVLPAEPAGTRVEYYFTAADTAGTSITWPEGGKSDPFVFHVGADTTPPVIAHEALPDQPLDMATVRVRARVTDNLDRPLRSVSLVRARNNDPSSSTPMTSAAGTPDYLCEFPAAGFALGDSVKYRIVAEDGATVANSASDPANGWHSFRVVPGFEKDLEADNGGLIGAGDWEWGHSSLVAAYSGRNVWATVLDGAYSDQTISTLECPPVDLSGFTSAALVFHHFLVCEQDYDGGYVEVSVDRGSTWNLIRPDGDYPARILAVGGVPGYSGSTGGWATARFDLYPFLGQADVRVRFIFASDEAVTGLGWYLDDISVVQRQIPARPTNLRARSGEDGRVPLLWDPPAGVVESGPNPVVGYNAYRSAGGKSEPVLLNAEPLHVRQYSDTSAVNGGTYVYYASALYAGGLESALSDPASASPYRAIFAADLASLAAAIDSSGVVDTTIVVRNAGTGFLEVNAYLADSSQSIDDVRIAIPMQDSGPSLRPGIADLTALRWSPRLSAEAAGGRPRAALSGSGAGKRRMPIPLAPPPGLFPPAEWDTVATDPRDPTGAMPDLAALLAMQTGEMLYLRVTAHQTMDALKENASMLIPLDTDENVATGLRGGEFVIVAGMTAHNGFGDWVALLDSNLDEVEGLAYGFIIGDHVEFGLYKAALGRPTVVNLAVAIVAGADSPFADTMPDGPSTTWLSMNPLHLSITAGHESPLALVLRSSALPVGLHRAKVILQTNDRARAIVEIPVAFRVRTLTPILLSGLEAEARDEGVVLSWRVSEDIDFAGFEIYRRELSPDAGEEVKITGEPLPRAPSGEYRYVDTRVLPGRQYEYRVAGLAADGEREFSGPITVTAKETTLPQVYWLGPCVPNPARPVTTFRYGIPRHEEDVRLALYSPDGRLVRTVLEGGRDAGYYVATWDGRDNRGLPAAAGLYFVLLDSPRGHRTQKVLLLR